MRNSALVSTKFGKNLCTAYFTDDVFTPMTNLYKVPQDAIEVCEIIKEDVSKGGKAIVDTRIVVPVSLEGYIRQYDSNIKLLYGRNGVVEGADYIKSMFQENELRVSELEKGCLEFNCEYLIVEKEKPKVGDFGSGGYQLLTETDHYSIYKLKEDFD